MIKEEIQVKIKIEDYNKFEEKLINKCAIFIKSGYEKTVRYDYENRKLEKEGKYIRVKTGFENLLTLKTKKLDDEKKSIFKRDVYELEIADIESVNNILENIGLKPILIMEKYRMIWRIDEYEIHVDELPFGIYVELIGNKKEIDDLLNKLELCNEKIIHDTYWDINKKNKTFSKNEKNIIFQKEYVCKLSVV